VNTHVLSTCHARMDITVSLHFLRCERAGTACLSPSGKRKSAPDSAWVATHLPLCSQLGWMRHRDPLNVNPGSLTLMTIRGFVLLFRGHDCGGKRVQVGCWRLAISKELVPIATCGIRRYDVRVVLAPTTHARISKCLHNMMSSVSATVCLLCWNDLIISNTNNIRGL